LLRHESPFGLHERFVQAQGKIRARRKIGLNSIASRRRQESGTVKRQKTGTVSLAESQGVDLILTPRSPFSGSKVAQA
jgi:hypothetical protein